MVVFISINSISSSNGVNQVKTALNWHGVRANDWPSTFYCKHGLHGSMNFVTCRKVITIREDTVSHFVEVLLKLNNHASLYYTLFLVEQVKYHGSKVHEVQSKFIFPVPTDAYNRHHYHHHQLPSTSYGSVTRRQLPCTLPHKK